jgi:phosphoenolpyruvate---glycerone phosphotransferase subunit DhaL
MITSIGSKEIEQILLDISSNVHLQISYLTELDSQIGDGDHGFNIDRGLAQVCKDLSKFQGNDIGSLLERAGSSLISSIGGASGPLFGTALRKSGSVIKGKSQVNLSDIARMFEAAENGVIGLGGGKVGDKTMLDSLHPAVLASKNAVDNGETDLVRAFESIVLAAESGLEATKTMVARKGRAQYVGERGLGFYDVGAASVCIILRSVLESLRRFEDNEKRELGK